MKSDRAFRSCHPQAQRGLSIIELMVGVAVGLFVAGGAAKLFVDNLSNNRRVLPCRLSLLPFLFLSILDRMFD